MITPHSPIVGIKSGTHAPPNDPNKLPNSSGGINVKSEERRSKEACPLMNSLEPLMSINGWRSEYYTISYQS